MYNLSYDYAQKVKEKNAEILKDANISGKQITIITIKVWLRSDDEVVCQFDYTLVSNFVFIPGLRIKLMFVVSLSIGKKLLSQYFFKFWSEFDVEWSLAQKK